MMYDTDYDFVSEPGKDFFCPVTFEILKDPRQTSSCCGQHLSRMVAERLEKGRKPCPLCNAKPLKTTEDPFFKRMVLALKVRCNYKLLGCHWEGELVELEKHCAEGSVEGECQFAKAPCPEKCGEILQRRMISLHCLFECVKRSAYCQYCDHKSTYEQIMNEHMLKCELVGIQCPNKCSGGVVLRCELKRHLDKDCPMEEIECEFHYAGCDDKVKRGEMEQHMEKRINHHLLLMAKHSKAVLAQLNSFTSGFASLESTNQSVSISFPDLVLKDFGQLMLTNKEWYSSSFYTHFRGYKMCLAVVTNGSGYGHIAVALCLVKGEFDDSLHWPFDGEVTVQLVNQQRVGGGHFEQEIKSSNFGCDCLMRVDDSGRGKGWGIWTFFPHSDLYNPKLGKEYLKNDSLKFRITKVIVNSVKKV